MPSPLPSLSARYTGPAIAFHWLLALVIVGTFGVGLYMSDLPVSPSRLKLYSWHKWAGVTILALSILRLLWRLGHRPPAHLPMRAWQARVVQITHGGLYALFFAVPLAGWAYSWQGFRWCGLGCCSCPTLCRSTRHWPRPSRPCMATWPGVWQSG